MLDGDASFPPEVCHITIAQRMAQIPTHRAKPEN
jgi:hypothetical protein